MSTDPLRVGIFGVGRMGKVHLEHLAKRALKNEIELVAVGDRYPPALESAVASLKNWLGDSEGSQALSRRIEHFNAPESMAIRAGLDAVLVTSRTSDHLRDTLAFTSKAIPVMVEKPVTLTLAEMDELVRSLGQSADRLVSVAFQRHYDEAAGSAMDWFRRGWIGELQQSHHVIQDKNPTPVGYQSGGITSDMAIHLVFESMSFHGFELPRTVRALRFNAPYYQDRAEEGANIVHVFCTWQSGSLAHLWGSRLNATGYDNGFKLIGTQGRIDVGEFAGDFGEVTAKLWRGTGAGSIPRGTLSESLSFPMASAETDHPDFFPRYARAYDRELGAFLEDVQNAAPFACGPEVGWKTLLVANVAEASSQRDGKEYELVTPGGRPIASAAEAAQYCRERSIH